MPDSKLEDCLARAGEKPHNLSPAEVEWLLGLPSSDLPALYQAAYRVKERVSGRSVSIRGLIEMGNVCAKDCYYCGIRRSNSRVRRYQLDKSDILRLSAWAYAQGYGSLVIQAGESESEAHTRFIEDLLPEIAALSGGALGVTLSLGEQEDEVFRRWRSAGAHRYLLRIETSSPRLYQALHPADHLYERRRRCLAVLRDLGYQVGTGVMSGLPGQSRADLAADIEFFRQMDVDMIGMGPYIPHPDTPLGKDRELTPEYRSSQLELGLRMIAVTRLYLHDVNLAATTALQALADNGREQGLLAGANVIMPNLTDLEYRRDYQLYQGKPCLEESAGQCRGCLEARVVGVGESIRWGERGDSLHYQQRFSSPLD
ncbi:MAG: [FeFe] hydrogenase H-cluster radical SAM maturase HydE [Planctomycetota bacterium]|jgi:biotin synthase|nr:[FeFe] hydrogenase H-cluster radical SAM maturase HydE [Planctomycetota bacterium]